MENTYFLFSTTDGKDIDTDILTKDQLEVKIKEMTDYNFLKVCSLSGPKTAFIVHGKEIISPKLVKEYRLSI